MLFRCGASSGFNTDFVTAEDCFRPADGRSRCEDGAAVDSCRMAGCESERSGRPSCAADLSLPDGLA